MMTILRQLIARILAVFQKSNLDRDFAAELDTHLALLTDEYIGKGMSPAEAHRAARIELGAPSQLLEAHRETRGLPFLDTLVQDVRYCFRSLRRDPGFTTFAILIVGLGIGASATIFSVVNALLLRPLPFTDPGRLVWIANDGKEGDLSGLTVPVNPFLDLRQHTNTLADVAAYYAFYGVGDRKLTGDGETERLSGVPVSQGLFPLLGVQPQIGRSFTNEECQKNTAVVLLSAGFWQRRYGSDPSILGRKLVLNDRSYTVLGVMPASFDFSSLFAPGSRIDLFLPLPLTNDVDRMGNTLSMIGRLKPGVTIGQAQSELTALSETIRIRNNRGHLRFKLRLLDEHVSGRFRTALFVLACAVGVVMLIVCANLSNLQLARAAARHKEMAIRVALGAGRFRLIRQMLTESVLLACCGGTLGLVLAIGGTRLLARFDGIAIPLRESVTFDTGALWFTLLMAILTGLVFGLAPALQTPSRAIQDALKDSNRGSTEGSTHHWIRSGLVVAEISFACILLVGAGLLLRSFLRVLDVDLGFQPESAVALRLDPGAQYTTQAKRNSYFDEVLRLAKEIPGTQAAGFTDALPLGRNRSWTVGAKGQVYSRQNPPPDVFVRIVSDGYLQAMGIPLKSGRDITAADSVSTKPVILINETLARTLWPGRDPIGQIVRIDKDREVAGVVGDVRHIALEQSSGAEVYLPVRQTNDYSSIDLVVRTSLLPAAFAPALRAALLPVEPNLPQKELRTLDQLVSRSLSPRRFIVYLLTGFSAFALILASLGIYGVVSYSVHRRTQELGIRMALGASAGQLQASIIFHTLGLAAVGILIGFATSWMLTRAISGLLFGVTPTDPITFTAMIAVLALVAVLAGYLPARRASRIDPMTALRAN